MIIAVSPHAASQLQSLVDLYGASYRGFRVVPYLLSYAKLLFVAFYIFFSLCTTAYC